MTPAEACLTGEADTSNMSTDNPDGSADPEASEAVEEDVEESKEDAEAAEESKEDPGAAEESEVVEEIEESASIDQVEEEEQAAKPDKKPVDTDSVWKTWATLEQIRATPHYSEKSYSRTLY